MYMHWYFYGTYLFLIPCDFLADVRYDAIRKDQINNYIHTWNQYVFDVCHMEIVQHDNTNIRMLFRCLATA